MDLVLVQETTSRKHNAFLEHLSLWTFEPLFHELRTLAVLTELCRKARHLFHLRLVTMSTLYLFLENNGTEYLHNADLVAMSGACLVIAELNRTKLFDLKLIHEATIRMLRTDSDTDSENDFLSIALLRHNNFLTGFP